MSRVEGRAPDRQHPRPARGRTARTARQPSRRDLREAVARNQVPGVRRRSLPPLLAVALVMLGLATLTCAIGGFAVLVTKPLAGIGLVAFAVVAGLSAWWLAHGRRRGYWSGVTVLALVGIVPMIVALVADATSLAVALAPPVVVAAIMLVPKVRASMISDAE